MKILSVGIGKYLRFSLQHKNNLLMSKNSYSSFLSDYTPCKWSVVARPTNIASIIHSSKKKPPPSSLPAWTIYKHCVSQGPLFDFWPLVLLLLLPLPVVRRLLFPSRDAKQCKYILCCAQIAGIYLFCSFYFLLPRPSQHGGQGHSNEIIIPPTFRNKSVLKGYQEIGYFQYLLS